MSDFLLPDLGEGLDEAAVLRWRVEVGDTVSVDQVVVEVETSKAAVELPVPFAGVVSALHATPGQSVAVGSPLISITPVADQPAGSGNVLIGYGTPADTPYRPGHRNRASTPAAPPAPSARVAVLSPLVRKIAQDAALDLHGVTGTGPSGLIRRCDVENALARTAGTRRATADSELRIPLRGQRKVIADKLSRSRREIPEATVWLDVDASGLLAARAAFNAHTPDRPVGVLALVARFAILGLGKYPELNGRVESDDIVRPSYVNLGFAAQTDRGLVVPVVAGAHELTTRDLSAALTARTAAARAGLLGPADLSGGTFTINNYGVFGVDGAAAIINYPEIAILGIGRIMDRPWAVDGVLAVRKVTSLTLTFDHRVCDGGTAGGFLRFVGECVESPILALAEL
ncbi:MAG TPA: dihydrolipoamide acetyltransferase family protein [Jatrophihabitantaceae bacterium]|jgi:2-oxoisovalerate dehydrogenase E2 component (dihydrolipoyl transacylase)|nr:dihydrolipoamide acetyltransferase family protein [Jatrophihabitantaceae bacterium]